MPEKGSDSQTGSQVAGFSYFPKTEKPIGRAKGSNSQSSSTMELEATERFS